MLEMKSNNIENTFAKIQFPLDFFLKIFFELIFKAKPSPINLYLNIIKT